MMGVIAQSVNALTIWTPLSLRWLVPIDELSEPCGSSNPDFDVTVIISDWFSNLHMGLSSPFRQSHGQKIASCCVGRAPSNLILRTPHDLHPHRAMLCPLFVL